MKEKRSTQKPKAKDQTGAFGALFSLMCVCSITRDPLFIGCLGYDQTPQLHLSRSRQTTLHALQGYNSNSLPRTGLQRVFVRPSRLYTRCLLSLLRTTPRYTSDALMCHGAPLTEPRLPPASHLRRRNSPRRHTTKLGFRGVPHDLLSALRQSAPDARCSRPICTFGAEGLQPSKPPRVETAPAKQHSHSLSSVSVIIKSLLHT
jgi:hypothetical protein